MWCTCPPWLRDNPSLDEEAYAAELAKLDPITRRQLVAGDWDAMLAGGFFEVDKIATCDASCGNNAPRVRAWDLAASVPSAGTDPDYTVGVLMVAVNGEYHIHDMVRLREGPGGVERAIAATAARDGYNVTQVVEQEAGSAGVMVRRHLATGTLKGYPYRAARATGKKYERAKPFAAAVANGIVAWTGQDTGRHDAMAELRAFSEDDKAYAHDDIVDACSLAYGELTRSRQGQGMIVGLT